MDENQEMICKIVEMLQRANDRELGIVSEFIRSLLLEK